MASLDKNLFPVHCPKCLGQRVCKFYSVQDIQDAIDSLESLRDVVQRIEEDSARDSEQVAEIKISGAVCYVSKIVRCGKPECRCMKGGQGHGPYWYAYSRKGGKVKCRYVGKDLGQHGSGPAKDASEEPQRSMSRSSVASR